MAKKTEKEAQHKIYTQFLSDMQILIVRETSSRNCILIVRGQHEKDQYHAQR